MLENVRFYKEETKNDPGYAEKLAANADLYVNDAFGTAHRAHASTEGRPQGSHVPFRARSWVTCRVFRCQGQIHVLLAQERQNQRVLHRAQWSIPGRVELTTSAAPNSCLRQRSRSGASD